MAVMVISGAGDGYDGDIGYFAGRWLSRWWIQVDLAV